MNPSEKSLIKKQIDEHIFKRKSDGPLLTEWPYTAQGFDRKFSNTNNLMKAKWNQKISKKKVKSPTG
jgi:hypothetical protein